MVLLKWTNKFSNETGYVESVSAKEKHFVNTFDANAAKRYSSRAVANRMIASLRSYGEAENNDFEIVEI